MSTPKSTLPQKIDFLPLGVFSLANLFGYFNHSISNGVLKVMVSNFLLDVFRKEIQHLVVHGDNHI